MKVNILLFISSIAMTACSVDYELTGERPDVNPGDVTECPFSVVDGTNLLSYDCNPVFTNTNETWGGDVGSVGFYATDVMGHPFSALHWLANLKNKQNKPLLAGNIILTGSIVQTKWINEPCKIEGQIMGLDTVKLTITK